MLTFIITFVVFVIVVVAVLLLGKFYDSTIIKSRLSDAVASSISLRIEKPKARLGASSLTKVDSLINSLSKLSLPEKGWQDSEVRLKFIRAGHRGPNDIKVFYAIKSLMTFVIPAIVFFIMWRYGHDMTKTKLFSYSILIAALGYYLPDFYLSTRTKRRIQTMQDSLPDLIDLLIICTESGLGMDAAINRVAKDSSRNSPLLSQEFYLTALEIRAGAGRVNALKNMALRTNIEDLNGFVSMLVQADKFGTSIADSLRIQSEMMRIKRMQRAEEKAAKVPVKILLPLILFIFPVLMIVLIGPAVIQMSSMFGK